MTINYWLIKFAPFRYSWNDCLLNGKFQIYSVRNPQARKNLKAMRINDEALFYHSQEGNCIMGQMKVIEEAHQDPTTTDERWLSVVFEPVATFANPVPLAKIKSTPELSNIALIRQARLSVSPLMPDEFRLIVSLGVMTEE